MANALEQYDHLWVRLERRDGSFKTLVDDRSVESGPASIKFVWRDDTTVELIGADSVPILLEAIDQR